MRVLHHFPLSPFCRKVRLALREKELDFEMKVEKVWERSAELLAMNPAGQVPVLIDHNGVVLAESAAICEYLDEVYPAKRSFIGFDPPQRAEARRLANWFDLKFHGEVTRHLLGEKLYKRFLGLGAPDSAPIRAGLRNIHTHLDYIAWLVARKRGSFLLGEEFTIADMAAAAQISCVDYLGDVPWDDHPDAKVWYMTVKSRPSFRGILSDHIPGLPPPAHYAALDF